MATYFINTDASSLGGKSPHKIWLSEGYAFTGGPINYGRKLKRLVPGDSLLMYANQLGIVGVGEVLEKWDGQAHQTQLVYLGQYADPEYRIRVRWHSDLQGHPVSVSDIRSAIGYNPSQALSRLSALHTEKVMTLIENHVKK